MDDFTSDLELSNLDLNDYSTYDLRNVEGITYPCVLLDNIHLIDILPLLNMIDADSNRRFPAWVFVDNSFVSIGGISLTFDTVFLMKQLGVAITIYEDSDCITTLNLNNVDVLEKMI